MPLAAHVPNPFPGTAPRVCPFTLALRLLAAAALVGLLPARGQAAQVMKNLNVVIIYADDLGWGDLSCYGQKRYKTPHIDRLAEEGARLTNFTSCCPYCAPSRVGLQTGRYPFRTGLVDNPAPDGSKEQNQLGLPATEKTLGALFRAAGYRTACIGKWHLGHQPQFHPLRYGYDEYFGILYSNDMKPVHLYQDERLFRTLVFQARLTEMYTDQSVQFIRQNRDRPFFLYLAHAMPHKPLAASNTFIGSSGAGLYGDVMAELDASVGKILEELKALQLDAKTLVVFSSDNGPWYGGSTGGLRGMKGQNWEGGLRVPLLARWPDKIPPGHTSDQPASMIDVFTTVLTAAGIPLPADRVIDGKDIMPLLTSDAESPHEAIFSMRSDELCTVRSGQWKLHLAPSGPRNYKIMRADEAWNDPRAPDGIHILAPPNQYHPSQFPGVNTGASEPGVLLFDLAADPSEQINVAAENPEIVERLQAYADKLLEVMPTPKSRARPLEKPAEKSPPAPEPKSKDDKPKEPSSSE